MAKGRPALTGERKQDVLRIRLDAAERALLDSAAAASGKPTSTWARDALLQLAIELSNPVAKKRVSNTKVGKK